MSLRIGVRVNTRDARKALNTIKNLDGQWIYPHAQSIRVLAEQIVGKRTRLLVHSIRVEPYTRGRESGFSVIAGDDWVIDYGHHHEFGTRFQEPRLYMTTALQQKLPGIRQAKNLTKFLRNL